MLLPALPRDQAAAVRLASSYLDGPHPRSAFSEAPLRGLRRPSSLAQAVANGRRARQAAGPLDIGRRLGPAPLDRVAAIAAKASGDCADEPADQKRDGGDDGKVSGGLPRFGPSAPLPPPRRGPLGLGALLLEAINQMPHGQDHKQ
jgi:hypothetical protein